MVSESTRGTRPPPGCGRRDALRHKRLASLSAVSVEKVM